MFSRLVFKDFDFKIIFEREIYFSWKISVWNLDNADPNACVIEAWEMNLERVLTLNTWKSKIKFSVQTILMKARLNVYVNQNVWWIISMDFMRKLMSQNVCAGVHELKMVCSSQSKH